MNLDERLAASIEARVKESLRNTILPRYLSPEDAAKYLGMSHRSIERWRQQGYGPPFSVFERAVRYDVLELDKWMAEKQQNKSKPRA